MSNNNTVDMSGWKMIKVSDLGKVVTGNTPPRKNPELYGDHTIFIKPTDVSEGEKYTYLPEECYSELGFKKYKNSLIPKGATCVVTIGSIGKKMTKAHCDCFINQAMNAVIPNANYDEEFVFYLLKYNLVQLKTLDSGTASGRENVSKSSFSSINLFVPAEKNVQQKIGKILSAYDDLIENNLKRIKLLEEVAQRTYEEWFVKFRINGTPLPIDATTGLPLGWEKKRFDDFCTFLNGYAYYTKGYSEQGYTVLDLGNIGLNSDLVISGKEKFIDEELYAETKKFHLRKYDVIIAMTDVTSALAILGRTAIVDEDNKYVLNQRVGCIRSKDNSLDYSIIYALHNDQRFIAKMKAVSKGAVQFYFNTKDVIEYIHIVPNKVILDQFVLIYKPLIEARMNLKAQNQKLKESRDILLPKLMNGSLNVASV